MQCYRLAAARDLFGLARDFVALPATSRKNRAAIEQAYLTVRRVNVARYLLDRLNRGTRVEIHPLNQSQVSRPHQRTVG